MTFNLKRTEYLKENSCILSNLYFKYMDKLVLIWSYASCHYNTTFKKRKHTFLLEMHIKTVEMHDIWHHKLNRPSKRRANYEKLVRDILSAQNMAVHASFEQQIISIKIPGDSYLSHNHAFWYGLQTILEDVCVDGSIPNADSFLLIFLVCYFSFLITLNMNSCISDQAHWSINCVDWCHETK